MDYLLIALGGMVLLYLTGEGQSQGTDSTDSTDDPSNDFLGSVGVTLMNGSDAIDQLFAAIQKQENVAGFHNNPAALTAPAANEVGASYTPNTTGGVVVNFATLQDGIDAGKSFLQNFVTDHSNLTLIQALATYINGPHAASTLLGAASGVYPDSVTNYANGVAQSLGVSTDTTLGSIFGGQ